MPSSVDALMALPRPVKNVQINYRCDCHLVMSYVQNSTSRCIIRRPLLYTDGYTAPYKDFQTCTLKLGNQRIWYLFNEEIRAVDTRRGFPLRVVDTETWEEAEEETLELEGPATANELHPKKTFTRNKILSSRYHGRIDDLDLLCTLTDRKPV